jgi:hypothetical protein
MFRRSVYCFKNPRLYFFKEGRLRILHVSSQTLQYALYLKKNMFKVKPLLVEWHPDLERVVHFSRTAFLWRNHGSIRVTCMEKISKIKVDIVVNFLIGLFHKFIVANNGRI